MVYVAVIIGVALIAAIVAPFFVGPGGLLAASQSINSPDRLRAMKAAVLKRYLEDEAAHKAGSLGNLAWEKRKEFLIHRYVDAARRLDYLESLARAAAAAPHGARAQTEGGAVAGAREGAR